jgi:hypothetical protein
MAKPRKRKKSNIAESNIVEEDQADEVESTEVESLGPPVVMSTERALLAVVMLVAGKQGKKGNALKEWVEAAHGKIIAVGITTLRESVEGILTLNQLLLRERCPQLHDHTMQALLMEAVDMVYWPESDVGELEVDSEKEDSKEEDSKEEE